MACFLYTPFKWVFSIIRLIFYFVFSKIFLIRSNNINVPRAYIRPIKMYQIRPRGTRVPKPRSGHRIVTDDNGNIYCFGGYNPNLIEDIELEEEDDWLHSRPLFKELWKFNSSTRIWTKLKTSGRAPSQLASHCVVLVKNNMIVYGGTGVPFGQNSSNQIYICNLVDLKWNKVRVDPSSTKPTPQYGQAIVYEDGNLYVVGGTSGFHYTMNVHQFNFKRRLWTQLDSNCDSKIPPARYRHEAILYNKKIIIFGGGTSEECYGFETIPAFDIEMNHWEKLSTKGYSLTIHERKRFPKERRCHACVRVDDDVYILGGTNGSNQICNDMWKLNMKELQWSLIIKKLTIPLFFHSASVSPSGELAIFGGITENQLRCNGLYSIWLKVPPLKELAWLTIMDRFSDILMKESYKNILQMGIPASCATRIHNKF